MLQLIVGTGLVCYIWKCRPSTALRVIEDTALKVPKAIGRKARSAKHAIKQEYRARMLVKMQETISNEQLALRAMSPAQLKQLAKDQAEVFARAEELRAEREAANDFKRRIANARQAPRASRKGRSAAVQQA